MSTIGWSKPVNTIFGVFLCKKKTAKIASARTVCVMGKIGSGRYNTYQS